jgi:predicted 3-demethylubiquinone-9 3-methyltransferase (glyoxalase superfamily)
MTTVTPFLWFDDQAEQAVEFYASVFPGTKTLDVQRYPEGSPAPGQVMTVKFELLGKEFIALNGGPHFQFNEAFSMMVGCDSQEQADEIWARFIDTGGEESQCGWLKDRFGLSWQIIPNGLGELLQDPDPARAARATQAMMQMSRIDLDAIRRAADGD